MKACYGVLLEAVSIQNYIFKSNTLKTNLGASYLIQHEIFDTYLKKAVALVYGKNLDTAWNTWKNNPSEIRIYNDPFEVGYIGGGNALLLFQEQNKAEETIKAWSRLLIVSAPGVTAASAITPFNFDKFRESLKKLFKKLRQNKAKYIPQTVIPRHGFTAECRQSGLSAEYWDEVKKEYVSSVTATKIIMATPARNYFHDRFKDQLQETYCFPHDFEKLGSISGQDSHIAVVHIDGNRMAMRFEKSSESLKTIRQLSISVHKATLEAFSDLVVHIANKYDEIMKGLGFDLSLKDDRCWYPMDNDYNKKCLPLTPIVLGGDDVTFVCNGKMGIYFAKYFIETFEKKQVSDKNRLTACAGVAIIKMKYPFYRGYQLSEELCLSAKMLNKQEVDPEKLYSYLDFQVSMGGISGNLDQIRKKHFKAPEGELLYRPYKLIPSDTGDEQSLDTMLDLAAQLKNDFPQNKIKELRDVLSLSKDAFQQYLTETKFRNRNLPEMRGKKYSASIFENCKTIYFDMIELTEFYPNHELEKRGSHEKL